MKVALFAETYLPYINGVVTHVKLLKEGLEKLGHEVLVVTADPKTHRHYIQNGVLHCPAKAFKRFYDYGIAMPLSHKRLKMIADFDPDIIHLHQEFSIGISAAHIAKKLNKPLVYTLHTMYDDYIYYVAPKPLIPFVTKLSHQYFRLFAKRANAITGPSKKCDEYIKNDCKMDKDVVVIPNPVELDKFAPENITEEDKRAFRHKYGIQDDEMAVCFCGRIGKEKSVDVVLDYWAAKIHPEDKMKLVIIGDGPCRPELEQQAKDLGIADMVVFTGAVPNAELPPYYAACNIYITASLSDTNSISMLEAMATGLPVLQRFDKLNQGQVRNGVNGYIFFDADDMYRELKEFQKKSPQEVERLRSSVRESVKQAGSENLANYLLGVYNTVFGETPNHLIDRPHRKAKVYVRRK